MKNNINISFPDNTNINCNSFKPSTCFYFVLYLAIKKTNLHLHNNWWKKLAAPLYVLPPAIFLFSSRHTSLSKISIFILTHILFHVYHLFFVFFKSIIFLPFLFCWFSVAYVAFRFFVCGLNKIYHLCPDKNSKTKKESKEHLFGCFPHVSKWFSRFV